MTAQVTGPNEGWRAPSARQRLKVLHVITPSRISGAERIAVAICRGLKERGHEVMLACKLFSPFPSFAQEAGLKCVELDIGGKLNLSAPWRLARLIRERGFDLIHTHLSTASLWGSVAGKLTGTPVVAHVHALNWSPCYLLADQVLVCSEAVKKRMERQGIPAHRTRLVHNGIDLSRFRRNLSAGEARRALGIAPEAFVIGAVGHLSKKKGQSFLIKAFATLLQRNPNLILLLIGEGPDRAELTGLAASLSIADKVRFAGYQPDVRPYMNAMDLLVLPSIAGEGLPLVLAEAGAMGIPAVAADIGGAREIIEHGVTGLIIRPRSVEALVGAIGRLVNNPEERRQMGEKARKRVEAFFTIERMIDGIESLYEELCFAGRNAGILVTP